MENEDVILDSSPEEVLEVSEDVETPNEPEPVKLEKTVPYSRFQEVNEELKKLKNKPQSEVDTVDLIKLGKKLQDYSDEELDFVTEFAKSKKPEAILKALENEFVKTGIEARRAKVEKERGLAPSGTQGELDKPKSVVDKLKTSDMKEKEDMLAKMGLYKNPRRVS